jgi:hypothetical protein
MNNILELMKIMLKNAIFIYKNNFLRHKYELIDEEQN